MTLELNLRFADPSHFIVSLTGDGTKALEFVSPFAAKDHEQIRWYIETYAAHYTTDVDDAEARRIEAGSRNGAQPYSRRSFATVQRKDSTTGSDPRRVKSGCSPSTPSIPCLFRCRGSCCVIPKPPIFSTPSRPSPFAAAARGGRRTASASSESQATLAPAVRHQPSEQVWLHGSTR